MLWCVHCPNLPDSHSQGTCYSFACSQGPSALELAGTRCHETWPARWHYLLAYPSPSESVGSRQGSSIFVRFSGSSTSSGPPQGSCSNNMGVYWLLDLEEGRTARGGTAGIQAGLRNNGPGVPMPPGSTASWPLPSLCAALFSPCGRLFP